MKSWASEMRLISEVVEVIHLINTQKEGGCFAFETLETFVGNVKCEESTALKRTDLKS